MKARLMAVAATLAVFTTLAQQDYSKVEIKSTQLAPGTWMLTGAGGNMGLSVGDDATFLVDDQFAPLSDRITAAIKAISAKPVKFIVNTHWHFDHTGGNENFANAGVVIVAHDNVYKRMSTDQFIEFMNMKEPGRAPCGAARRDIPRRRDLPSQWRRDAGDARGARAHGRRFDRVLRPQQRDPHGRHVLLGHVSLRRHLERRTASTAWCPRATRHSRLPTTRQRSSRDMARSPTGRSSRPGATCSCRSRRRSTRWWPTGRRSMRSSRPIRRRSSMRSTAADSSRVPSFAEMIALNVIKNP